MFEFLQTSIKIDSSVDLAPEKVRKRKLLSELTPGTVVTPRHREISWIDKKYCTALEVFQNKIVVGWNNGQIGIYSSTDLDCQTVLNYCRSQFGVSCLQCTGTEIMAGYDDRNIRVWEMQNGLLMHRLSLRNENDDDDDENPTCMRWRDPKLVVGTDEGRIYIWQYASSSLTLMGSWDSLIG